ncbi:asparagine synthase (glutamine-hydrolyzing) [Streptomyces sp. NPDC012751]|uniref:asparagine synthase (glutamine-hydrolyzing) n=1 Tax=Streptomyces sp. NPDC012751 TaxID=3364846 RepID=UPI0036B45912
MCGIAGWVAYRHDLTEQRRTAEAMTGTMACRGPDDEGLWTAAHAAMGHRRLAVIDLPGGRQPMTVETPDGPVVLIYTGECYNYTELRDELRGRGHHFLTASDTEVVLRGYLEWGAGVAERLNGMYAFALWDARDEQLFLVRDRMGVKPLYYYPTADGVLFGSEPKAILVNPLAERVVTADGLRELFGCVLGFVKTPGEAVWRGMREVVPGTVVRVDRGGLHVSAYWKLGARRHTDDIPTTVGRVRELVGDTVRRQLVADVESGVLLSGGLDSSAIAALSAQIFRETTGERIRTYSVAFAGRDGNGGPYGVRATPDLPFAHDLAAHAGTDHRDVVLDASALADAAVRRATVGARDLPLNLGDMDSSLYLLCSEIRKQSTVVLSGEAADELFGGYRWFHDPGAQRSGIFPWLETFSSQTGATLLLEPSLADTLDLRGHFAARYQEALAEVPAVDGEDAHERRMREISYLHLTRFVRVLLDRKDRMSMAAGLEVRVPFCDHRLVDYVFNAPWSSKTYDGMGKSLLRQATKDLLPESVMRRVKVPYPSTQDPGYIAELQRQSGDVLREGNSEALNLVDCERLRKIAVAEPEALQQSQRAALERLLELDAWFDLWQPTIHL